MESRSFSETDGCLNENQQAEKAWHSTSLIFFSLAVLGLNAKEHILNPKARSLSLDVGKVHVGRLYWSRGAGFSPGSYEHSGASGCLEKTHCELYN
jgi:hypothetical protein